TAEVARAEADGYVLGLANTSTHAVAANLTAIAYDPAKDFAPVSMLGSSPFVLALYPGVPAQTVQDLIALAKIRPRMLNYASAGPATLAHLSGCAVREDGEDRAHPRALSWHGAIDARSARRPRRDAIRHNSADADAHSCRQVARARGHWRRAQCRIARRPNH